MTRNNGVGLAHNNNNNNKKIIIIIKTKNNNNNNKNNNSGMQTVCFHLEVNQILGHCSKF